MYRRKMEIYIIGKILRIIIHYKKNEMKYGIRRKSYHTEDMVYDNAKNIENTI